MLTAPRRRSPWTILVVAWAVAVLGVGYVVAVRHGVPTDREQTAIEQALPTLDTALAAVAAVAIGPGAPVVAVLSGYRAIGGDCRITLVRRGVRYQRALDLYLPPAGVRDLLDRVAAGLPPGYGAAVTRTSTQPTLTADAGNFVAVRATVPAPGRVRVTADTGCRTTGPAVGVLEPLSDLTSRAPVQAVLDAVGLDTLGPDAGGLAGARAVSWRSFRISCPGRSPLWTIEAQVRGLPRIPLAAALPSSALLLPAELAEPELYAYRDGVAAIAIHPAASTLTVTATTGCAPPLSR